MILATVGTTKFPFNRLLQKADRLMMKKASKEKLIVQKGTSDYQFQYPYVEIFKEIAFSQFINFLKKADLVITHAGPATVFLCLKYCQNRPLIMPRLKKFGEHVDNHQYYFAKFLQQKNRIFKRRPSKIIAKLNQYCQNLDQ